MRQMPSTGCRRQPKPLLEKASPSTGNRRLRSLLPWAAEGRGVTAKTDSRRNEALEPAFSDVTGTVSGVELGGCERPVLDAVSSLAASRPLIRTRTVPRRDRDGCSKPDVHSFQERAPSRQAASSFGAATGGRSAGTVSVSVSRLSRSSLVITRFRSSCSRSCGGVRGCALITSGLSGRAAGSVGSGSGSSVGRAINQASVNQRSTDRYSSRRHNLRK